MLISFLGSSLFVGSIYSQETASDVTLSGQKLRLPGIATQKPETGRFIALSDGRFMIPYTSKIPGTEIEFTMMPIPGGTFEMGSGDSGNVAEVPVFDVKVEPFWMAKYEVTWAEFDRFMKMEDFFKEFHRNGVRTITEKTAIDAVTAPSTLYDPSYTYDLGELPNQPAVTMTQFSAKQYTKWLSLSTGLFYRIPFESEWEYACRAGTKTKFYFGDNEQDLSKHAWFEGNANDKCHAVGQLKPNSWGLHDMLGNASEWTLDQYEEQGYLHIDLKNLRRPLTVAETFNRPKTLYPRVLRGGSIELLADDCRSASRLGSSKKWKDCDPNYPPSPWWFTSEIGASAGFRIIRPLNEVDRQARETFWKADLKSMVEAVRLRIDNSGRGAAAPVDDKLHEDIEALRTKAKSDRE